MLWKPSKVLEIPVSGLLWGAIGRAIVASLLTMVATPLAGQTTFLGGTVLDPQGVPVADAEVGLASHALSTRTDLAGRFRLANVPLRENTLNIRRLGFVPAKLDVTVPETGLEDVVVRLTPSPFVLNPVLVRREQVDRNGRLGGYYSRLSRRLNGVFITREEIDRERPRTLTHLLTRIPGVTPYRARGGNTVRLRGRGRACGPLVWLDGAPLQSGDVDLDGIAPSSLHGIEIYLAASNAPSQFIATGDGSSCGTIILWSRGPDTDPIDRPARSIATLERLISLQSVFTADQVDEPARLALSKQLPVEYPSDLLVSNVGGTVVAEFVVSADGWVEAGTIGIVSSPHPALSRAVLKAILQASYAPARKGGRAVRQVVQQPFEFTPALGRRSADRVQRDPE